MIDPEFPDRTPPVDERMLRQFSGVCLAVCGTAAIWQTVQGRTWRAAVFGVIALGVGGVGVVAPRAVRFVFGLVNGVTKPVGIVVTRLVLGALFFGVFSPIGRFFGLIKRDPLKRVADPTRSTYWTSRPGPPEPRRYLRQF